MSRTPIFLTTITALALLLVLGVAAPRPLAADSSASSLRANGVPAATEIVVVRAFFDDRAQIETVVDELAAWEVRFDKGYLVVDVTGAQYQVLEAAGFRLEIDAELTATLNRPPTPVGEGATSIPGYPCYRTVEETFASAQAIATNFPTLATWTDIGNSWEKDSALGGYDIMVLKLTNSATTGPKPKAFIMTGLHAREYTPPELAMRFAEGLVADYGTDPDVTWLLDDQEVHIVLHANPDGRKKAETGLSWRKNTNQNYCSPTSNSRGADLNRNFEFLWGCCGGSSGNQCSSTYRGPSAASEPETQAIQDYVRAEFPDQRGPGINDPAPADAMGVFLDIHSYSELMLWAWGFTSNPPPNSTALQTLGRKLAYWNGYIPQQAINLYPTDGTTDDFAYGELGLAAYTYELGTAFFQACGTFENTILPDNLPSLLYAAKVARTPYMTPAGPEMLTVAVDQALVAPGTAVLLTATADDTRYENGNGAEPTQNIVAAEYYVDVPPWDTTQSPAAAPVAMTAVDGSFNSSVEDVQATIDTTGWSNGRHVLYTRAKDADDNWGVVGAAFLYVIDPATAPTLQGYVREAGSNLPLAGTVVAFNAATATTDPSGFYQMDVISGTFDVDASAPDHESASATVTAVDGQTVTQDFSLAGRCNVFSDDVEGGDVGWTTTGNWATTTEAASSPTHSWTDSPGGNYGNNQDVSLTSPLLDLSAFSNVNLSFNQICDTEATYDFCRVEVSTDGGSSWTELNAYDGPPAGWEAISLDASALDGAASARFRFRLDTDFSIVDDGWHVDDIVLSGTSLTCGTTPTAVTAQTPAAASVAGGIVWPAAALLLLVATAVALQRRRGATPVETPQRGVSGMGRRAAGT